MIPSFTTWVLLSNVSMLMPWGLADLGHFDTETQCNMAAVLRDLPARRYWGCVERVPRVVPVFPALPKGSGR